MTAIQIQQLTFSAVDSLSFAFSTNKTISPRKLNVGSRIGPLLEWLRLTNERLLDDPVRSGLLTLGRSEELLKAKLQRQQLWLQPESELLGFYRPTSPASTESIDWIKFSLAAQKAAKASGFDQPTSAQLVAAFQELVSNIHEHSGSPETAFVAFSACPKTFEFVVCDDGDGLLSTLRTASEYSTLEDEGRALELTLTDGVSRFGASMGRGYGFRPIFTGLANIGGHLRFRSGDHALTISGGKFRLPLAQVSQRLPMPGFSASVLCQLDGTIPSSGW
jgi:anti-sigma regulatory factor (Ser/Thr protein kinase)